MKKELSYRDVYLNFTKGEFSLEDYPQDSFSQSNEATCLLALQAAVKHDTKLAQKVISTIDFDELHKTERFLYLEVQVITSYFIGNFKDAKQFSEQAITLNSRAFFSLFTLARLHIRENDFETGISYYKSLLDVYPNSNGALLDLAKAIVLNKGSYQEVFKYIRQAKSSLRRSLYLFLIPFGKPFIRLLWAIVAILAFSIPDIGTKLFLLSTIVIILVFTITLIKIKLDILIITRLLFIQLGNTLLWLIIWAASKQSAL